MTTARKRAGVTRVNSPALRQALATIEAHRDLLAEAICDQDEFGDDLAMRGFASDAVAAVAEAVRHVLDGFRSLETRGGS